MVMIVPKQLSNGKWQELNINIPIRFEGKPLWVQNPVADVAAIYINLPNELFPHGILPMTFLAKDEELRQFEVHPGDELNVLGFPLGFATSAGFPVLRSGKIASYPLLPTKDYPYFLLDFRVFEGNSGGPVYMVSSFRFYNNSFNAGTVQMILGLVSAEERVTQQTKSLYEDQTHTYPLGLARIVPASFIVGTIMMLPPPN
jgi:S1-C subfamily serine protease